MNKPVVVNFDPREIGAQLRSMTRELDVNVLAATQKMFNPLHAQVPYDGTAELDISYGPDPRHLLDVFSPRDAPAEKLPVHLFVHGGGFVRGDTRIGDLPYHENVGRWAVNNGLIGVNMTYRLAPDHLWPAGAEDVGAAVAWVKANIADHGGDPDRLILHGHSAGSTHSACYLGNSQFHGPDGHGLAGIVLGSGSYELKSAGKRDSVRDYFGADRLAEASPLPGLIKTDIPFMLYVSEIDLNDMEHQILTLAQALLERDEHLPRIVRCYGHNHYSPIFNMNLGTGDALGSNILEMIAVDVAG